MPTESEIMGGIGIGDDPFFGDDDYYQPIRNEPMGNNYRAGDFNPPNSPYKYNPLSTKDLITQQIYTNHIKDNNSFSVEAELTRNNMVRKSPNSPVTPSNLVVEQFTDSPSGTPNGTNETQRKCGCKKCMRQNGNGKSMWNVGGENMILLFFLFMILAILIGNSIMLSGRVNSLTKTMIKVMSTKKL